MKIKTNYANAPVWKEVTVKSRIPDSLKMLQEIFGGHGIMKQQICLSLLILNYGV